jgi:glycine oxidase
VAVVSEPVWDAAVVGAGVVGLSAARALSRRDARVVVLDAASPGGLGSRAAAGVGVAPLRLRTDARLWELARLGGEMLERDLAGLKGWSRALERRCGLIRVATGDDTRAELERVAADDPALLGRWVGQEELVELEPALRGTRLAGGYVREDAVVVDAAEYLSALADDAAAAGARLRLGERVLDVAEGPDGVDLTTDAGRVRAGTVVVAAGAWSGALPGLPPLPVRPLRGQMVAIRRPGLRLRHIISSRTYLAPWRDGEICVGATEEDAGFDATPTVAGVAMLCAHAVRVMPASGEATVCRAWAGIRATTTGGRPLIGCWPERHRVLVGAGHGGQGILTGALTGLALADLVERGASEVAEPFDPGRAREAAR